MASVARENIQHLAALCGFPRSAVELVAEGDDGIHAWAVCKCGGFCNLTSLPHGGEIDHAVREIHVTA